MTQIAERQEANVSETKVMNMVQALNNALDLAIEQDPNVVVYGEDVGVMGGVMGVTVGLQAKHGKARVFDAPLTESGILGTAVGMSIAGLKPVVELQFAGFMYPGYDHINSHLSRYRDRSRGRWSTPVVFRMPYGGGVKMLEMHGDSPEALLAATPGIKIGIPSNPIDAKGMMLAAIEDPDPVAILESIKLYRSVKAEVPTGHYTVPLGKANIAREGSDVTVLCYGNMVPVALEAAKGAEMVGIDVEVIDLRWLVPLDIDTILESVQKTGRVVVVYEAPKTMGFGAELSAMIAEKAIYHLEAPIVRVAGFDSAYLVYGDIMHHYHPSAQRVAEGIQKVMES